MHRPLLVLRLATVNSIMLPGRAVSLLLLLGKSLENVAIDFEVSPLALP